MPFEHLRQGIAAAVWPHRLPHPGRNGCGKVVEKDLREKECITREAEDFNRVYREMEWINVKRAFSAYVVEIAPFNRIREIISSGCRRDL